MRKRLNLIIVPDEGGAPRRVQLSTFWLKTAGFLAAVLLLAIIAGAVTWTSLARQALEYNELAAENERLELKNRDILRVAREVDQSRQILSRIIRSLGGHLELGRSLAEEDSLYISETLPNGELPEDSRLLLGEHSYAIERIMAYTMPTQMPIDGFISQGFHEDHLFTERSHLGIDIAGKTGTPVRAAAAGRVVFSGWTTYFGNCLMVAHIGGYLTFYGHNSINLKKVRKEVDRGEPIGLLGNSGRSSAPHLHFEIWKDGVPVDPQEFVKPDSAAVARM